MENYPQQIKDFSTPVYRLPIAAPHVQILNPTTSIEPEQITVPPFQAPSTSFARDSTVNLGEMYKSLKRVPKKSSTPTRQLRVQQKMAQPKDKTSVSRGEETYYDSVPFFDIERLSYSRGRDKTSSV